MKLSRTLLCVCASLPLLLSFSPTLPFSATKGKGSYANLLPLFSLFPSQDSEETGVYLSQLYGPAASSTTTTTSTPEAPVIDNTDSQAAETREALRARMRNWSRMAASSTTTTTPKPDSTTNDDESTGTKWLLWGSVAALAMSLVLVAVVAVLTRCSGCLDCVDACADCKATLQEVGGTAVRCVTCGMMPAEDFELLAEEIGLGEGEEGGGGGEDDGGASTTTTSTTTSTTATPTTPAASVRPPADIPEGGGLGEDVVNATDDDDE